MIKADQQLLRSYLKIKIPDREGRRLQYRNIKNAWDSGTVEERGKLRIAFKHEIDKHRVANQSREDFLNNLTKGEDDEPTKSKS